MLGLFGAITFLVTGFIAFVNHHTGCIKGSRELCANIFCGLMIVAAIVIPITFYYLKDSLQEVIPETPSMPSGGVLLDKILHPGVF